MPHDNPFLWVALDESFPPENEEEKRLLHQLHQVKGNWGWKINLDTMLTYGCGEAESHLPDFWSTDKRQRFGDAKTHNGRRTMLRVLEAARESRYTYWNFHLDGCDDLTEIATYARHCGIKTLGLTQMSHGEVSVERVQALVTKAEGFGMDEVILPAFIADKIKTNLSILGTGFRPQGPDEHQPHALHPSEACGLVDSVAIGTPIMKASDPVAALQQHLGWLSGN